MQPGSDTGPAPRCFWSAIRPTYRVRVFRIDRLDAVTRSRWLLRRVEIEDENAPAELIWTLGQVELRPPGKSLTLVWMIGVLRLASALSAEQLAEAEFHREAARQAFLECLDRLTSQGRAVSHGKTTRNYAPRVMAEMLEDFARSELEQAMEACSWTG